MNYIQARDLLPKAHISRLHDLVSGMNGFPWYFLSEDVAIDTTGFRFGGDELLEIPDRQKACGFTHLLLDQGGIESPYLPYFYGLLDTVKDLFDVPVEVFRLRLALQLNNGIDHHNAPHTDSEEDHYAGLFYFHDSSGETVFFNQFDDPAHGTIEERWMKGRTQKYTVAHRETPEANKFVFFNGHQYHSSSNPITNPWRVVLNFNIKSSHDLFAAYKTNNN